MNGDSILSIQNDTVIKGELSEYKEELTSFFYQMPEVAGFLLKEAKSAFSKIEKALYTAPTFINAVKSSIPDVTLQAALTDEQRQQIAKGAIKLLTKKDGTLMANLINPKTKKIVATIPLKSVQMAPEMNQAIMGFSAQMQMAQIAEQIQAVQIAVEEVRMGQEFDRLATAYSCQQKFLQTMSIQKAKLKEIALLQLVESAEDSRNLLMLSQKNNVKYIIKQPEGFFQKMISGSSPESINSRMSEISQSLCAINMVSFTEAMAYRELGEHESAKESLLYYARFIDDTYISVPGLVQRMDMIDPAPGNHWSNTLPAISEKIKALPDVLETNILAKRRIQGKSK